MHLLTGAGRRGSAPCTEHLRVPDLSVGTYVAEDLHVLVVFGPAEHSNAGDAT